MSLSGGMDSVNSTVSISMPRHMHLVLGGTNFFSLILKPSSCRR